MAIHGDTSPDRPRAPERSPLCVANRARYLLYWIPIAVAIGFLFLSGWTMISIATQAREVITVNLQNTCRNADFIRPMESAECWHEYTELSGKPRPVYAGEQNP